MELSSKIISSSTTLRNKNDFLVYMSTLHSEVTGSCHIVTVKLPDKSSFSFLVDFGMFQGEQYADNTFMPFVASDISFMVLTHVHNDHCGRIPYLVNKGFGGRIYTTDLTASFLEPALNNTCAILNQSNKNGNASDAMLSKKNAKSARDSGESQRRSKKSRFKRNKDKISRRKCDVTLSCKKNGPIDAGFIFSQEDVQQTMSQVRTVEYNNEIKVDPFNNGKQLKGPVSSDVPKVKLMFIPNAHILGAALILVKICYPGRKNINLLFTGDYASKNRFFNVPSIPKSVLNLKNLNVIVESTYGSTFESSKVPVFERNIIKACNEGKQIVIPVFAMQRCQEVLLTITKMKQDGLIPKSVPVILESSLAIAYTNIFLRNQNLFKDSCKDFLPDNFSFGNKGMRDYFFAKSGAKIFVAASGMCSFGPVVSYIRKYISNPKAMIHLTGYSAKNSLSRALRESDVGDEIKICGCMYERKCDVKVTSEFSSHATKDELLRLLSRFSDISTLFINHGEPDVMEDFATYLSQNLAIKNIVVESPSFVSVISSNGLQKTFNSKY